MKPCFLAFIILIIPLGGQAFWTHQENIKRVEYSLEAEISDDRINIQILEKVQALNPEIPSQYLLPFPHTPENLSVFADFKGLQYGLFQGEGATSKLWEMAEEHQDLRLLGLQQSDLLLTEPVKLKSDEHLTFKITYQIPAALWEQVYSTEIFTQDALPSEHFKIKITSPDYPHLLPIWPGVGDFLKNETQRFWWFEDRDFTPLQNLPLWWSKSKQATIQFPYKDRIYNTKFEAFQPLPDEEVIIILDRSGSMYGANWDTSLKILAHFLEHRPSSMKFDLLMIDETVTHWNQETQENTRATQQALIQSLAQTIPLGKSDTQILDTIWENQLFTPSKKVLLIGDFENFTWPEKATQSPLTFMLDFAKNPTLKNTLFSQGSSHLKGLRDGFEFIQSEDFEDQWFRLSPNKQDHSADTLPTQYKHIPDSKSLIWSYETPRRSENIKAPATTEISARHHARRQVAAILKTQINRELTSKEITKLDQLSLDFDLSVEIPQTQEAALNLIEALENPDLTRWPQNGQWNRISTLFPTSSGWISTNFKDQSNLGNTLHIAPFSEAQKALWTAFPHLFTSIFSLGQTLDFCHTHRCISLNQTGRHQPQNKDLMFWSTEILDHWSLPSLEILAERNIITIDPYKNLDPNAPLTRRQFVQWLFQYHQIELEVEAYYQIEDLDFKDPDYQNFNYLVDQKIIRGIGDQKVGPDEKIKRSEAVKILLAFKKIQPLELETRAFPDTQGWVIPWANRAHTEGLISGERFRPNDVLTWGEGAVLITK